MGRERAEEAYGLAGRPTQRPCGQGAPGHCWREVCSQGTGGLSCQEAPFEKRTLCRINRSGDGITGGRWEGHRARQDRFSEALPGYSWAPSFSSCAPPAEQAASQAQHTTHPLGLEGIRMHRSWSLHGPEAVLGEAIRILPGPCSAPSGNSSVVSR